jgi:Domain of unknown function (DUF4157)/DNA/RNA non-specific endonuclease
MKASTRAPSKATVRPRWQAKPRITQPGDNAEREADRLADAALAPARGDLSAPLAATRLSAPLMRQVAEEPRREPEYEEDEGYDVAAKGRASTTPAAPAGFLDSIRSRPVGRPLAPAVRDRMERGFGHSFASVRIHADSESARLSDAIHARAFTHGQDIFFAGGEYAPGTRAGDRLLAHELAHTLQQAPPGRLARQRKGEKKKPPREHEPTRMTDAEKIRLRAQIRQQAQAWTKRYRDQFAADPTIDAAERARWDKAFDTAIRTAKTISDPAQKTARVSYLEAERELFKDDFYAWVMIRQKVTYETGTHALEVIADPKLTFKPPELAFLAAHRARMRAGADVYVNFINEARAYQRLQLRETELETAETSAGEVGIGDDLSKAPADPATAPATGAFEAATLEDRELLEEVHTALADLETEEGLEYDQEAFLAELAKLSPEDRKDFYEFVRSMAPPTGAAGTTASKALDELLEMFNKLDPSSREALKVNREVAEAEGAAEKGMPESVRLKLEQDVAAEKAAADDAREIQSDLDRIRAKALPPELAKELSGIDFGVSPFFNEVAMLLGLLAGGGERSALVKEAGNELLEAVVKLRDDLQRQLRELAIESAAIAAATVVTKGLAGILFARRIKRLAETLRTVKRLIDTAQKVYDVANRIKRIIDVIAQVRTAYPAFLGWYERASAQYVALQRVLEKFDPDVDLEEELEKKEDELIQQLDDQLEGQLGQVLEMLFIPEDTPPDELRQILFDIPRGMVALEDMWKYYKDPAEEAKPHFANVLAVRAFRAGRLLFPFVGFASHEIATAFRSAFPERPVKDRALSLIGKSLAKPARRERHRGLFGRLNRRRYDIKPGALTAPLDEATKGLETAIGPHEPGSGASEHWTPFWFRRIVRREIKTVNRAFRTRTVPARRKPDKRGGPAPPEEMVPMPPFRVRLRRPGKKDVKLVAVIKVNPERELKVDRLSIGDFAGQGVEFSGEEPRKDAIRKFLREHDYDVVPHPDGGEFVRLRGGLTGTTAHPWLVLASGRIKQAELDKEAYKPFLNRVIGDEHDLPEGYHLADTKGGVNVALKKSLAQKSHRQLGLGEGRKLVEGAGKAAARLVAPLNLKPPRLEAYNYVAAVDATLAPAKPGVSPFKPQRSREQWLDLMRRKEDLRQRPKAIEGTLGYTVRARALGGALSDRYLPELREEDDKGHLVARRFGSPVDDPYWNLVPMLRRENQFPGRWYRLESEMADIYVGKKSTGKEYVEFGLTLVYPTTTTRRPSRFVVKHQAFDEKGVSIEGGEKRKTVEND